MIPKKIHYCWLSNDPLPSHFQNYINGWREKMPDYEIIKWDLEKFPLSKSLWVQQAYKMKKYAFAADYIRLYALSTEGGIYLDSDVEVLKPYDDLLHLPYFICNENSPMGVEAATIGAEKGCFWINKCFEYYNNRVFLDQKGNTSSEVLPKIMINIISSNYNVCNVFDPSHVIKDVDNVYLLPSDFFSPKSYVDKKIIITQNTYSIHHFAGSWIPFYKKMILLFWVPFSVKFPRLASYLKYLFK